MANLKKTLLIVDDDKFFVQILVSVLSPLAEQVLVASNGLEALQIVKSCPCDTVVTDLIMPKMSGIDFIAELRALKIVTPIILITGSVDLSTLQARSKLDQFQILEKPFDPSQVIKMVEQSLGKGFDLRKAKAA